MAESIDIVANIDFELDVKKLKKQLETEMGTVGINSKKSKETTKSETPGSGSEIAFLVGLALGNIVGELQSSISNIIKTLLMFLTPVGLIVGILQGIGDLFGALWDSFKGVTKMWGVITNLISQMVEPFVNLLLPLFLPFIMIASQLVKFLNMMLAPLFAVLMETFTGGSDVIAGAMQKIIGGDIIGGIADVINFQIEVFQQMGSYILETLMPLFKMFGKLITDFLTIDMEVIQNTLNDLLGKQLGSVVGWTIKLFYNLGSTLAGVIASFVGMDNLKGIGIDTNKIMEENKGFETGVNIGEALKELYDNIMTFLNGGWVSFTKGIEDFTNEPLGSIFSAITNFLGDTWDGFIAMIEEITGVTWVLLRDNINNFINTTWSYLKKQIDYFIFNVWLGEDGLKNSTINLSKAMNKVAKTILNFNIQSAINSIISSYIENEKEGKDIIGGVIGGKYNDFIYRPGQGISTFSPDDTVIGVKDTSKLMGSGQVNNTYNIYGNGDRQLLNLIRTEIEKTNASASRKGYYQKGY